MRPVPKGQSDGELERSGWRIREDVTYRDGIERLCPWCAAQQEHT
jgi:hypothetical protein